MVFSHLVTRRGRWAAALLLLCCGLASTRGARAEGVDVLAPFEQLMSGAEASLQKGDLAAAEKLYRQALFEGWMVLGTLARLDRKMPAARAAFEQAVALAPEHRAAVQSLAGAQMQTDAAGAAAALLAPLAARDARDLDTRLLMAKALAASGDSAGALRTLDEAAAAAGSDPEALFRVAAEYLWLKKPGDAERLFTRLLAERPLPETGVLIGRTYRDAGEYDRARAHLLSALEQDARVRRAHYYLGMVAMADARGGPERIERAIAEFRAELALDPQDALAGEQLGRALLDAGRPAEARPVLEVAARVDPRPASLLLLGRALLEAGQPAVAAEALQRARDLAAAETGSAEAEAILYQLGLALRRTGRSEEAARALAEARRLHQEAATTPAAEPVPVVEFSPLAELTPQRRRAVEAEVRPGLARAYLNLGVMRAQAQDFTGATERLGRAAELDPGLPRVQYTLGVAAFNARQYEKAVEALTRALSAGSDVAETNAALGLAYFELGRLPEAEAALRLALQARPEEGATRDNLARVLERIEERRKEKP
jgi:tetratricopeptide (TPR) repeat protein